MPSHIPCKVLSMQMATRHERSLNVKISYLIIEFRNLKNDAEFWWRIWGRDFDQTDQIGKVNRPCWQQMRTMNEQFLVKSMPRVIKSIDYIVFPLSHCLFALRNKDTSSPCFRCLFWFFLTLHWQCVRQFQCGREINDNYTLPFFNDCISLLNLARETGKFKLSPVLTGNWSVGFRNVPTGVCPTDTDQRMSFQPVNYATLAYCFLCYCSMHLFFFFASLQMLAF